MIVIKDSLVRHESVVLGKHLTHTGCVMVYFSGINVQVAWIFRPLKR